MSTLMFAAFSYYTSVSVIDAESVLERKVHIGRDGFPSVNDLIDALRLRW